MQSMTPADLPITLGQAFYWAPGHSPEALEDTAYVDFSPTSDLEAVIRHIKGA